MGVSGAGKTTVGELLAGELGWPFADADSYHSAAHIEKMRSGVALTDTDRAPWLKVLRNQIAVWISAGQNVVLACSALKHSYREELQVSSEVHFVYLRVTPEVLRERLLARRGHYMTEKMLASQLEALEEPKNKQILSINGAGSPAEIVAETIARLR
jgi:gluconokinase